MAEKLFSIKLNKERLIFLIKEGWGDTELSRYFKCHKSSVKNQRASLIAKKVILLNEVPPPPEGYLVKPFVDKRHPMLKEDEEFRPVKCYADYVKEEEDRKRKADEIKFRELSRL